MMVKNVWSPLGGFEPPTFRLTAERANRLRHKGLRSAGPHELAAFCMYLSYYLYIDLDLVVQTDAAGDECRPIKANA